jgi:hypothetical protein
MIDLTDPNVIAAAIEGFEKQAATIEGYLVKLRRLQNGAGSKTVVTATEPTAGPSPVTKKRRVMSAASRKAMAAAQKKRWAEYHKRNK